jgi:cytoskeletal protein CcmA (bactofilin family)
MFRRKKSDHEEESVMSDASEGLGLPAKPMSPRPIGALGVAPRPLPAGPAPVAAAGALAQTPTTTLPPATRPLDTPTRRPEGPIIPTPKARDTEQRRLIVGREISLTGEITSCDRLIVEGSVEANLTNCREVEIAESGLLKGTAAIEDAEVRGRFEGTLTVRKRLHIKATGKVVGQVRYGQLEIECGGQVSGDVQAQPGAEDHPPQRIMPMAAEFKA